MRRLAPVLSFAVLVSLLAGGTAWAAAPVRANWVYYGRTTQGIPVRLSAASQGDRVFRYRATMACNDGDSFTDDFFTDDVTLRADRFSVSYTSNAGAVSTRVTGILAGRRASGTVRIVERYSQLAVDGYDPLSASGSIVCDSHTVHWSATA